MERAETAFVLMPIGCPNVHNVEDLDRQCSFNMSRFDLKIPFVENTAKIVILRQEQILAERIVSPNPPTVKVVSPRGGEVFRIGELITIRWEGSDIDGDVVLYSLAINVTPACGNEDGPWVPLVQSYQITKTETHFEIPDVPSYVCNSVRIRVIATDGINTAEDISESFSFIPK